MDLSGRSGETNGLIITSMIPVPIRCVPRQFSLGTEGGTAAEELLSLTSAMTEGEASKSAR
jgi:hypothetical protein